MRAALVLVLACRVASATPPCASGPPRASLITDDATAIAAIERAGAGRARIAIEPIWERGICRHQVFAGHRVRIALDPRDRGDLAKVVGRGIVADTLTRAPDDAWIELRTSPDPRARTIGAIWRGSAPIAVAVQLPAAPRVRAGVPGECVDDFDMGIVFEPPPIAPGTVHLSITSVPNTAWIESRVADNIVGQLGPPTLVVDGVPVTASTVEPRRAVFVVDPRCPDGKLLPRKVTLTATWPAAYRFASSRASKVYSTTMGAWISIDGRLQ